MELLYIGVETPKQLAVFIHGCMAWRFSSKHCYKF